MPELLKKAAPNAKYKPRQLDFFYPISTHQTFPRLERFKLMSLLPYYLIVILGISSCQTPFSESSTTTKKQTEMLSSPQDTPEPDTGWIANLPVSSISDSRTDVITLGAGCFWCVEAVFESLQGVIQVASGYMGGSVENPSYRAVCSGLTGHAEVCQITFLPDEISIDEILEVFWSTHDPTTLNRQGADKGTQYRSVIFCHSQDQARSAFRSREQVATQLWDDPVVTELSPAQEFYEAEDYHQNYYRENPEQGYCRIVIAPKMAKFKKKFEHKIRK